MARNNQPPNLDNFFELLREFENESDRGIALVIAAWADDSLRQFLKGRLVDDSSAFESLCGRSRPCESFSAIITLAYCVGHISQEVRKDLDIIRDIRNDFAHGRTILSFDDQSITARCNNLNTPGVFYRFSNLRLDNARMTFLLTGIVLVGYLLELGRSPDHVRFDGGEAHGIYTKKAAEQFDLSRARELLAKLEKQIEENEKKD
jgi:hypothetical protein